MIHTDRVRNRAARARTMLVRGLTIGSLFAVCVASTGVARAQVVGGGSTGGVSPVSPAPQQPGGGTLMLPTPTPGQRVQAPGDPAIYLIDDDGTKRHIPDPQTYNNLFRDWTGIQVANVEAIPSGPDLTSGAYLAWDGVAGDAIYLVSNGQKRWITSPATMDKFDFASTAVRTVVRKQLEPLPSGPVLD